MKVLKKIRLSTVEDKLSDTEMKMVVGGYSYPGSGTEDDPYQLPGVTVTCGQSGGQCWRCELVFNGAYSQQCRRFTGNSIDYCSASIAC